MSEIEKQTGYCKSTVRKTLVQHGVVIRNFHRCHKPGSVLSKVMRSGGIPYGYAYLDGELVIDPHEYKVVLQIRRLWKEGRSLRAIAKALTEQNVKTRHGRPWRYEVIKKIVDRYKNELKEKSDGT